MAKATIWGESTPSLRCSSSSKEAGTDRRGHLSEIELPSLQATLIEHMPSYL